MKILHCCGWVGGISTRNVAALKQHSRHSHELVVKQDHCYDLATEPAWLTENNTTKEMVAGLAEEADVLHFHAVGYNGSAGLPGTVHGIDWSRFLGNKRLAFHGMVSDFQPNGTWTKRHGERFEVTNLNHYDALFGPHLSCKFTYDERLQYVPDMIPLNDWLYTPCSDFKNGRVAATFKDPHVVERCRADGIDLRLLPTPTKLTEQLAWRRKICRATFDNCTDGHWGLYGLESLSQGIPTIAYTHPVNMECWEILGVPPPPIIPCEYGGADVPNILRRIFDMGDDEWNRFSMNCRRWIETFYNPQLLVKRWDDVFDTIL